MNDILSKLFEATDNHGDDSGESDHTVGDLQSLLGRAWALMSISQRRQFLNSDEVEDLLIAGARDEFCAEDLLTEVDSALRDMATATAAAGYTLETNGAGYYWQFGDDASEDFHTREDAVSDAYKHLGRSKKTDKS